MARWLVMFCMCSAGPALGDDYILFSDGSTAWRNEHGQIWGRSHPPGRQDPPGAAQRPPAPPSAFGDDGTFYVPAGPQGVWDTRTGQLIPVR